jgi:hypothetical protein
MDYLKIIRPVNLAMVVLTQLLFWFFIVVPIHRLSGSIPDMQIWQVLLLVLVYGIDCCRWLRYQ